MKYKQIVFDVDGTLIDTEYAILHSLQDTIEHMTGTKVLSENLSFALGIPGKDALYRLGITDSTAALSLWDTYMKKYMDAVSVFDGIIVLFKQLADLGYGLGIVTSETKDEFAEPYSSFLKKWRWSMSRKFLLYETVVKAQRGEPEAVDAVLSHYAGYIKYTFMLNGRINADVAEHIKQKLIESLVKFKFDR